jgi:5-methyltetrahydrofolate--homocysteine methyltransferase
MLIVGEKINATSKRVAEAIASKDATFITDLASSQASAGADYIDINAGTGQGVEQEVIHLNWVIDTVHDAVNKPLCLDSPDPSVLTAALEHYQGTDVMVNSVNAEPERLEPVGRSVAERNASVVALVMGESGIPATVEERLEAADTIMSHLSKLGVSQEQVYFDPLVLPISVDTEQGMVTLRTIEQIKSRYPSAKTIMGLSNVSYGLPNRGMVNRGFLLMAAAAGLDAAILDPTDSRMMSVVRVADMLAGKDATCKGFIRAHRKGLLIE